LLSGIHIMTPHPPPTTTTKYSWGVDCVVVALSDMFRQMLRSVFHFKGLGCSSSSSSSSSSSTSSSSTTYKIANKGKGFGGGRVKVTVMNCE